MTPTQFSPIRMTAATQDAAVTQALQIVGVSADEVSVEILSEDAKGVTVRVSPRRDDQPTPTAAIEVQEIATEETQIDSEIEAGDSAEMTLQLEDEASEVPEIEVPEIEETESVVAESVAPVHAGVAPEAAAVESAPAETAPVEIKLADEATQERVRVLAQDFLERMGLTAQANITDAPANGGNSRGRNRERNNRDRDNGREERDVPRAFLQIDGEDVGILIGKHGQTLQSFQYLLNVTLNNQMSKELGRELGNGDGVRVLVDAGGYRVKRSESLQQMAQDAAARAKSDCRAIRMEPMSAQERRLVHIALEGDSEISTSSEGREPLRHVVVIPAGAPRAAQSGFGGGSNASSGEQRGGFGGRGGNRGGFSNGGSGNSGGGGFNRRERGL